MITSILFEASGMVAQTGGVVGDCRVCGESSLGMEFNKWVRPTFTDFDKLQSGDIICHACLFCFDERSQVLARRVGKEKPQRMRNYSHFVVDDEWLPLSKANKHEMYAVLMRQPVVAVIAISGQKHLIFRAQPGWWQIEEQSVPPFPVTLQKLLGVIEELYLGFSKVEIGIGNYRQHRILKFGLSHWYELEKRLRAWRGGAQFELALFLAQRKEIEDDATSREGGRPAGDHLAGHTQGLQEPLPAEHLAAIRGSDTVGGVHGRSGEIHQLTLL